MCKSLTAWSQCQCGYSGQMVFTQLDDEDYSKEAVSMGIQCPKCQEWDIALLEQDAYQSLIRQAIK